MENQEKIPSPKIQVKAQDTSPKDKSSADSNRRRAGIDACIDGGIDARIDACIDARIDTPIDAGIDTDVQAVTIQWLIFVGFG